eukprot:scaffold50280_cov53-Phaeocystis_antarctica.AAC.1
MHAASDTYSRVGWRCSLTLPCLRDGRARCSDVCITPTHVGCTARLLRPAYDGRARCSDACRITHLLSRRVALLA